jgi:hypothetical protein
MVASTDEPVAPEHRTREETTGCRATAFRTACTIFGADEVYVGN